MGDNFKLRLLPYSMVDFIPGDNKIKHGTKYLGLKIGDIKFCLEQSTNNLMEYCLKQGYKFKNLCWSGFKLNNIPKQFVLDTDVVIEKINEVQETITVTVNNSCESYGVKNYSIANYDGKFIMYDHSCTNKMMISAKDIFRNLDTPLNLGSSTKCEIFKITHDSDIITAFNEYIYKIPKVVTEFISTTVQKTYEYLITTTQDTFYDQRTTNQYNDTEQELQATESNESNLIYYIIGGGTLLLGVLTISGLYYLYRKSTDTINSEQIDNLEKPELLALTKFMGQEVKECIIVNDQNQEVYIPIKKNENVEQCLVIKSGQGEDVLIPLKQYLKSQYCSVEDNNTNKSVEEVSNMQITQPSLSTVEYVSNLAVHESKYADYDIVPLRDHTTCSCSQVENLGDCISQDL